MKDSTYQGKYIARYQGKYYGKPVKWADMITLRAVFIDVEWEPA